MNILKLIERAKELFIENINILNLSQLNKIVSTIGLGYRFLPISAYVVSVGIRVDVMELTSIKI